MLYVDYNKNIKADDNFWKKEADFWSSYGRIYRYLEGATPYKKMLEDILKILSKKQYDRWLDAGCGPGTMINFLLENNIHYKNIIGLDFDGVMIDQAIKRLSHIENVSIKTADLSQKLEYEEKNFDAIIANLVLSYVIIFGNKYTGKEALVEVLKEMHRLLNVGGILLWTTPVDNVNFTKVFIASWKEVLNPFAPYIYYGPQVLSYALKIQKKGKLGIYHFLSTEEIHSIMEKIGFKNINIKKTFANQAYLVSANK